MYYVTLSAGKIMVHPSNLNREGTGVAYDTEEAAAEALVSGVMAIGQHGWLNSSSLYHPEDEGMPDFDFDRFVELVNQKFTERKRAS